MDSKTLSEILAKAFLNAGKLMGMTSSELNQVLTSDISLLSEIDPESKEGVRALYFIRSYKKLYSVLSGDEKEMKLWMKGGIPAQQAQEEDIAGLVRVIEYIEAMP